MFSKSSRLGFTLLEIMVAVAVLAVVLAIAIPNFLKMWMVGNEGAVIESMRAVAQACESFRMQGPTGVPGGQKEGGYPVSLQALTDVTPRYLDGRFDPVAANGESRGYQWAYEAGPRQRLTVGTQVFWLRNGYTLRADPTLRGVTGQRSFFTDQSGVVRFNLQGPAGPNDTPIEQAGN